MSAPKLPFRLNGSLIAWRGSEVLVVKKPRPHHAWQFPQGGAEPGETLPQTALREFHEELGTDKVTLTSGECGVFRYFFPAGMETVPGYNDRYCGQEVHFFCGQFLGDPAEIRLAADELVDHAWVSPLQAVLLFEDPTYRRLTAQILSAPHA